MGRTLERKNPGGFKRLIQWCSTSAESIDMSILNTRSAYLHDERKPVKRICAKGNSQT